MGCEASLPSKINHEKSNQHSSSLNVLKKTPPSTSHNVANLKRPTDQKQEQEFIQEALQAHNTYRTNHGAQPLQHNQRLTEHAQQLANELAKRDMLLHSNCILPDGELIGENIYSCWSPDGSIGVKASVVVRNWYNEIDHYNFEKDEGSSKTANFTQLIWKDTKEFGIAKARSLDGTVYVVAIYKPVGNITGLFHENVCPEQKPSNAQNLERQSSASTDASFDYSKYGDLTNRVKTENNKIVINLIMDEAKRTDE